MQKEISANYIAAIISYLSASIKRAKVEFYTFAFKLGFVIPALLGRLNVVRYFLQSIVYTYLFTHLIPLAFKIIPLPFSIS